MVGDLALRIYKVKSDYNLKFLEGRMWKNNTQTELAFRREKDNDLGHPRVGAILIDLVDEDAADTLDTITIPKERYDELIENGGF